MVAVVVPEVFRFHHGPLILTDKTEPLEEYPLEVEVDPVL